MLSIKGLHVGMQNVGSDEDLTFCRQMGLEYVGAYLPVRPSFREMSLEEEGFWNADALVSFREYVEPFDLKLAASGLSSGSLKNPEEVRGSNIVFKTSSKRDHNIERICQCIEAAGKAGIHFVNKKIPFLPVALT